MTKTIRTLLALAALVFANGSWAQMEVSGPIAASVTWKASEGPYVLTGTVEVQQGATVTIEAGTTVYMGAGAGLTVTNGSVQAMGTADSPVVVSSDKVRTGQAAAPGDWGHWVFGSGTASSLSFTTFQYGQGLQVSGATLTLDGVAIKDQQGAAMTQDLAATTSGLDNTASGNTLNAIIVPAGDMVGTAQWGVRGIPYLIETGVVSVGASARITSISPTTIKQGETVTLTLTGERLGGASSLHVEGAGVTAQPLAGGSSTRAIFSVAADLAAAMGPRRLTLTTDAGEALFAPGLEVIGQQPILTSISPATVTASGNTVTLDLAGIGFAPTSKVFADATELPTNFVSHAALTATGTFSTAGVVQISVRTPDPDHIGSTFTTASLPLTVKSSGNKPDLVVSGVVPGAITANADGSYDIPVSFKVTNVGGLATPASFTIGGYLSSNGALDSASRHLLGAVKQTEAIGPGGSVTLTTTLRTARTFGANADWPAVLSGSYTLFVKADATGGPLYYSTASTCVGSQCTVYVVSGNGSGGQTSTGLIAEESEGNNAMGVPLVLPAKPDLVVSELVPGAPTANADGSYDIPVSFKVTNVGALVTPASFTIGGYLSNNGTLDGASRHLLGAVKQTEAIGPGGSVTLTTTLRTARTFGANADWPAVPSGSYTLFVKADATGGPLYYSTASTCVGSQCTVYVVSGNHTGGQTSTGLIAEESEGNNAMGVPLVLPAKADLVVSELVPGAPTANADGSYDIPVSFKVTNVGGLATPGSFTIGGYLSSNEALDGTSRHLLGAVKQTEVIGPGGSVMLTTTLRTARTFGANADWPAVPSGSYTLFVKADATGGPLYYPTGGTCVGSQCTVYYVSGNHTGGQTSTGLIAEEDENNNAMGVPLALPAKPDLVVSELVPGALTANADGSYDIPVSFKVTNVGGLATPGSFTIGGYLSSNGVLDSASRHLLGAVKQTEAIGPGGSVTLTTTLRTARTFGANADWPAVSSGSYTLFVKADATGGPLYYSNGGTCVGSLCTVYYVSGNHTGGQTSTGLIAEEDENNNAMGVPLVLPAKPDLVVSELVLGALTTNADWSYDIPVSFKVTNVGGLATPGSFTIGGYLSSNGVLDSASRHLLGAVKQTEAIGPGGSVMLTTTLRTARTSGANADWPEVPPGSYTLFVKADATGGPLYYSTGGTCVGSLCTVYYVSGNHTGGQTSTGLIAEENESNNAAGIVISF